MRRALPHLCIGLALLFQAQAIPGDEWTEQSRQSPLAPPAMPANSAGSYSQTNLGERRRLFPYSSSGMYSPQGSPGGFSTPGSMPSGSSGSMPAFSPGGGYSSAPPQGGYGSGKGGGSMFSPGGGYSSAPPQGGYGSGKGGGSMYPPGGGYSSAPPQGGYGSGKGGGSMFSPGGGSMFSPGGGYSSAPPQGGYGSGHGGGSMYPPGGAYSSGGFLSSPASAYPYKQPGSGFPDYGSNLYGSYGSHGSQGSQGSQTNELGWTPAYGAKYGNVWPSNDTCVFNQTASDLASTQWLPMQGGRDSLCTNGTEYLFGSQHIWCRCNPGFRGGGLVRQNCDPECASMCMDKYDCLMFEGCNSPSADPSLCAFIPPHCQGATMCFERCSGCAEAMQWRITGYVPPPKIHGVIARSPVGGAYGSFGGSGGSSDAHYWHSAGGNGYHSFPDAHATYGSAYDSGYGSAGGFHPAFYGSGGYRRLFNHGSSYGSMPPFMHGTSYAPSGSSYGSMPPFTYGTSYASGHESSGYSHTGSMGFGPGGGAPSSATYNQTCEITYCTAACANYFRCAGCPSDCDPSCDQAQWPNACEQHCSGCMFAPLSGRVCDNWLPLYALDLGFSPCQPAECWGSVNGLGTQDATCTCPPGFRGGGLFVEAMNSGGDWSLGGQSKFERCELVPCRNGVVSITDAGATCTCNNGYAAAGAASSTWVNSAGAYSASCTEVACPYGTVSPDGSTCTCWSGYANGGAFDAQTRTWTNGICARVLCQNGVMTPATSDEEDAWCTCNAGYIGGGAVRRPSQQPVDPCVAAPAFACDGPAGVLSGSTCSCAAGYAGGGAATGDGLYPACTAVDCMNGIANTASAICTCDTGYIGGGSFNAATSSYPACTPATCANGTVAADRTACACDQGFGGGGAWNGEGYPICVPATCAGDPAYIDSATGFLGCDCSKQGWAGSGAWQQDQQKFDCEAVVGPICPAEGWVGDGSWLADAQAWNCTRALCGASTQLVGGQCTCEASVGWTGTGAWDATEQRWECRLEHGQSCKFSAWRSEGACSQSCTPANGYSGTQYLIRSVIARETCDTAFSGDTCKRCPTGTTMDRKRSTCNNVPCPTYTCHTSPWSACTSDCGSGVKCRTRTCRSSEGHTVDHSFCQQSASGAACSSDPECVACNTQSCPSKYFRAGKWSRCSKKCTGIDGIKGKRWRTVTCVDSSGTPSTDQECIDIGEQKPADSEECNTRPCVTYAWAIGAWGACSRTCGGGQMVRSVKCEAPDGSSAPSARSCGLPQPQARSLCATDECTVALPSPLQQEISDTCKYDRNGRCCPLGVDYLSADGQCCGIGEKVAADGTCCSGNLDACGQCNGSARAVDVRGICCASAAHIGDDGLCCQSGMFDSCGVCDGDDSSCNIKATVGVAAGTSRADFIGFLATIGISEAAVRLSWGGSSSGRRLSASGMTTAAVDVNQEIVTASSSTGAAVSATQFSALMRKSPTIAEIRQVGTNAVCGNGVCEHGERCRDDACRGASSCRQDCPFVAKTCPSTDRGVCNGQGRCIAASGACECFLGSGYVGAACDQCDITKRFRRVKDKCQYTHRLTCKQPFYSGGVWNDATATYTPCVEAKCPQYSEEGPSSPPRGGASFCTCTYAREGGDWNHTTREFNPCRIKACPNGIATLPPDATYPVCTCNTGYVGGGTYDAATGSSDFPSCDAGTCENGVISLDRSSCTCMNLLEGGGAFDRLKYPSTGYPPCNGVCDNGQISIRAGVQYCTCNDLYEGGGYFDLYEHATGFPPCTLTNVMSCPPGEEAQLVNNEQACVQCSKGRYNNDLVGPCVKCAQGTIQDQVGQLACDLCGAGTFIDEVGATQCKKCAAGKYGDVSGASSPDACRPCASAEYQPNEGATTCFKCARGKKMRATDLKDSPLVRGVSEAATCEDCPGGRYQQFRGQTVCENSQCSDGFCWINSRGDDPVTELMTQTDDMIMVQWPRLENHEYAGLLAGNNAIRYAMEWCNTTNRLHINTQECKNETNGGWLNISSDVNDQNCGETCLPSNLNIKLIDRGTKSIAHDTGVLTAVLPGLAGGADDYYYYRVRASVTFSNGTVYQTQFAPRSTMDVQANPQKLRINQDLIRAQPAAVEPAPDPGTIVRLEARVSGRPRVSYEWFYDGQSMSQRIAAAANSTSTLQYWCKNEEIAGEAQNVNDQLVTCTISNVQRDAHQGNYFVMIKQGTEQVQSRAVDLTINYLNTIVLENKPAPTLSPDQRIAMVCPGSSPQVSSPPASVVWIRLTTDKNSEPTGGFSATICKQAIDASSQALEAVRRQYGTLRNSQHVFNARNNATTVLQVCAPFIISNATRLTYDKLELGYEPSAPASHDGLLRNMHNARFDRYQTYYCMGYNSAGTEWAEEVPVRLKECEGNMFMDHKGYCRGCPLNSVPTDDRTGCVCQPQYFATSIPTTEVDNVTGQIVDCTIDDNAALSDTYFHRVSGFPLKKGDTDGVRRARCHRAGLSCHMCDESMQCENASTTFENVITKKGYWQDKDFFNLCNRGTGEYNDRYQLYRRAPCTPLEIAARQAALTFRPCIDTRYCDPPKFSPTNSSGCRVGHTGPMCLLCEEGWAYATNGFCQECSGNTKVPQETIVAAVLTPIFVLLILGLMLKLVLRKYNFQALKMMFSLNEAEEKVFFGTKDQKQRFDFLCDIRRAVKIDETDFAIHSRRVMSLIQDHETREAFLVRDGAEQISIGNKLIAAASHGAHHAQRAAEHLLRGNADGGGDEHNALMDGLGAADNGEDGMLGEALSEVRGAASDVRDAASEMASELRDGAAAAASELRDGAAAVASELRDGFSDAFGGGGGSGGADGGGGNVGADGGVDAVAMPEIPSLPEMPDRGAIRELVEQGKITLSLIQVLSQWKVNFDIQWPEVFVDFTKKLAIFNFTLLDVHAIACTAKANFIDKFLFMSFFPIILFSMLFVLHKICKTCGKMQGTLGSTSFLVKFVFVILFIIYPSTCNTILKTLDCDTLEDGSKWLKAQYSISCAPSFPVKSWLFGEQAYVFYQVIAGMMIFVYPLGVPLGVFVVLRKNRETLFEPLDLSKPIVRDGDGDIVRAPNAKTAKYLGSLYLAYSAGWYWWESLELIRKLMLTGIIIFCRPNSATQLAIGCFMALTWTVLYSEFKPYLYSEDDVLQLCCQLSIFCTMFSGLLIKTNVQKTDGYNEDFFSWFLVVLNGIPIIIGVSRMIFVLRGVWYTLMSKRVVVTQLSKRGAVKEILAIPHFPKIQDDAKQKEEIAIAGVKAKQAGEKKASASRWKKAKNRGKVEPLPPELVAQEVQARPQVQVVVQQPATPDQPAVATGASSTPDQQIQAAGKGHRDHEEHKVQQAKVDGNDRAEHKEHEPDKDNEFRMAVVPKPGAQVQI